MFPLRHAHTSSWKNIHELPLVLMGQSTCRTGIDKCSTWDRWDPDHWTWQGSVKSVCGARSEGMTAEMYAKTHISEQLTLAFYSERLIFVPFSFQAEITQRGARQFCICFMENIRSCNWGSWQNMQHRGWHYQGPNTFDVSFRKLPGQGEALPAVIQAL